MAIKLRRQVEQADALGELTLGDMLEQSRREVERLLAEVERPDEG